MEKLKFVLIYKFCLPQSFSVSDEQSKFWAKYFKHIQ